jgi:hypothetical protein
MNEEEFKKILGDNYLFMELRKLKTHDKIKLIRRSTGLNIELTLKTHFENLTEEDVRSWDFLDLKAIKK